ncbi:MAG TPA: NTP transferase domain-containing protein [Candidatus Acidoferrales bacterium]|nr:NTP transferase domain-containing protein [Candidatus Acidoferrales bacterium]
MVATLQGAILAAGHGERLRKSGGAEVPKPLVELGGQTMLARQARAMLDAGAASVLAVVNSETSRLAAAMKLALPERVRVVVRDTSNSMETMLTLGEFLAPGWFVASTVDAIVPPAEFARFVAESQRVVSRRDNDRRMAGVLAVTRWRGESKPLFAEVAVDAATNERSIARLGGAETALVTAGLYFLSTRIFELSVAARSAELGALRNFLGLLLERGMRLGAVEIAGAIDVDDASDLAAARRAIRSS